MLNGHVLKHGIACMLYPGRPSRLPGAAWTAPYTRLVTGLAGYDARSLMFEHDELRAGSTLAQPTTGPRRGARPPAARVARLVGPDGARSGRGPTSPSPSIPNRRILPTYL
jgi:hypothetical protein